MNLELCLRVAGALQLVLVGLQIPLARRMKWRTELAGISLLTRQIFFVHAFFIALVLTMFGLLSLLAPAALMEGSPLGAMVSGGISAFWLARLVVQWCVYDPRLWRGDAVRTRIHFAVTVLWIGLAWVYAAVLTRQLVPG